MNLEDEKRKLTAMDNRLDYLQYHSETRLLPDAHHLAQRKLVTALEQLEQAREALRSVTHQAGAEDIDEYCVVARGLDFGSYEQGFSAAVEIIRRRCRKALEQQQEVGDGL